tara:strand:+ start:208 stop:744 length:537 start_codon:yes stop_codon:yes gene_type:complete
MALTQVVNDGLAYSGMPTGAILQVKRTIKTDIGSFASANTDTYADIPGMSVAITPKFTSSDILVFWSINISQSTTATQHVRLLRGSTAIAIADQGNSAQLRNFAVLRPASTPYDLDIGNVNGFALDSPSSTSEQTYKLQGTLGHTYSGNYYINRGKLDTDEDYSGRTVSHIMVMEVAG